MENSVDLLLILVLVHILGDFALQSNRVVNAKHSANVIVRYKTFALHSLIHAVLSYIALMNWGCWIVPLAIFVSHFIIDSLKSYCKNRGLTQFFIDQFLHLSVIIILWYSILQDLQPIVLPQELCINLGNLLIIAIAYLLILKPSSVVLGFFFSRWSIESELKGLPNAGKWIGYFERILILTFILSSQAEMIGFLIAAKSIFRFGELKNTNEIKVTEYILIGTLASFTIAVVLAYIAQALL